MSAPASIVLPLFPSHPSKPQQSNDWIMSPTNPFAKMCRDKNAVTVEYAAALGKEFFSHEFQVVEGEKIFTSSTTLTAKTSEINVVSKNECATSPARNHSPHKIGVVDAKKTCSSPSNSTSREKKDYENTSVAHAEDAHNYATPAMVTSIGMKYTPTATSSMSFNSGPTPRDDENISSDLIDWTDTSRPARRRVVTFLLPVKEGQASKCLLEEDSSCPYPVAPFSQTGRPSNLEEFAAHSNNLHIQALYPTITHLEADGERQGDQIINFDPFADSNVLEEDEFSPSTPELTDSSTPTSTASFSDGGQAMKEEDGEISWLKKVVIFRGKARTKRPAKELPRTPRIVDPAAQIIVSSSVLSFGLTSSPSFEPLVVLDYEDAEQGYGVPYGPEAPKRKKASGMRKFMRK